MHPRSKTSPDVSVSLVLPAWNECEGIERAINEAVTALSHLVGEYEVIVVDDGSTDNTADLVRRVCEINPQVRLVAHNTNQGYGAALRSGFAAARNDLVAFTDADCQFDLAELDRFILLSERYDVVCGYRIDRKDSPLRCLYSKVYNQLVRVLLRTGVRDVDCALKMFHREVIQGLSISGNGFLVNSEILTQANQQGRSIVEVGVSHRPRTEGQSTVSARHIPKVLSSLARYWWNQVQFPSLPLAGDNKEHTSPESKRWVKIVTNDRVIQFALLLVAAVFLFVNLGYPLIDRDETRYAEIPREMIATGNWILPQLNFQTYYDKPPLVYWLCAISYSIFGVSETAARLVPCSAAWLMMASTMWFGSRQFGKRIGSIAGAVLLLSAGFAFTGRYLLLDGVLSLLVSTSLFTAYEAIRSKDLKMGWWLLSGVLCGLAFLTKGPLALVLWFPPVFAFAWLAEGYAKPTWKHYSIVGLLAVLIACPWFIAVSLQDPAFLEEFFFKHNVRRFAGDFHHRPFWYFVPVILVAGHPWSFLTIPYGKFLFGNSTESRRERPAVIGFLLLCSIWAFVFFSMSKCKLPTYLLPAAPLMALMIGHYLDVVLRSSASPSSHWFAKSWSARGATTATCIAGIGFVAYVLITQVDVSITIYVWAMLWTCLLVSALALISGRHQAKNAWATSSIVAFLFSVMVMHQLLPMYSRSQTLFGSRNLEVEHVADALRGDSDLAIATVAHEFSGVPFYLNRTDVSNFKRVDSDELANFVAAQDRCVLIVKRDMPTTRLVNLLPIGAEIRPLGSRGIASLIEVVSPPVPYSTQAMTSVARLRRSSGSQ